MLKRIAQLLTGPRLAYLVAHMPHLLVGIVIVLAYTRLVPREEFGVFAVGFAFVNVAGALLFGWLPAALTRLSGGTAEAGGPRPRVIIFCMLLPAVPCMVLAYALQAAGALAYALPTALATMGFSASLAVTQLARGLHRPGVYGAIGMVRMSLVLLAGWWFTRQFGADAEQLLMALALGGGVGAAAGMVMLRGSIGEQHQASSVGGQARHLTWGELWRYGWAAAPSIIAIIVMLNADRIVLQWFLVPADIARFSAQSDLARQMVYPLVSALSIGLVPGALNVLRREDMPAAQRFVIAESRWLLLAAVPLTLAAGVFGPVFASLLLPAGYVAGAAPVMAFAAFAAFLMACRLLRYDPLFHLILKPQWIGGSALLALCVWGAAVVTLGRLWGGAGAALAGCFGSVTALVVMHAAARRRIKLPDVSLFPTVALLGCIVLGGLAFLLYTGLNISRFPPVQAASLAAALIVGLSLLLWPVYTSPRRRRSAA